MEERDEQDLETPRKPTLVEYALRIHERLSHADLEDIRDYKRAFLLRTYRFFALLIDEITRTELTRRAASLTYITILSLFPFLAVVSAFATQFYTEDREQEFMNYIERQFLPTVENVPMVDIIGEQDRGVFEEQQQKVDNVREFFTGVSEQFRQSAGGVGIFGFIGLLVAAGILYYSIESVVNQTWREEHSGRWTQTLTNFITILVFAPIVIGLSIAATGLGYTLLEPEVAEPEATAGIMLEEDAPPAEEFTMGPPSPRDLAERPEHFEEHGAPVPIYNGASEEAAAAALAGRSPTLLQRVRTVTAHFGFVIKAIPVMVNTLLLAIAYAFLPKTKVRFLYALIGAFIAACLWEFARYLFVYYMYWSRINRSLVDAFGLVVIFLIWVYITWLILLLGNLLVYVTQNFSALWFEKVIGAEIAIDSRLYLATMILLGWQFTVRGGGYSERELRVRLGLTQPEFRRIADRLLRQGFISPMQDESYQLAHPPDQIRVRDLLAQGCNLSTVPIARRGRTSIARLFTSLEERLVDLCGNATLKEIIEAGPDWESKTNSGNDAEQDSPGNEEETPATQEAKE